MNIRDIFREYKPNSLTDDEYTYHLKSIISNLSDTDRTILLLYADLQSLSKTASLLQVSKSTVYVHIQRIRKIIQSKLC